MKRFLILFFALLLPIVASAQFANHTVVDLRGSRVFVNGERISNSEVVERISAIHGLEAVDSWTTTCRAYRTGLGLTIGGASLAVLGGTTTMLGALAAMGVVLYLPVIGMVGVVAGTDAGAMTEEMMRGPAAMVNVGAYMLLGSAATLATGIPLMCINKKKLDGLFREYDYGLHNEIRFTFGPTSGGVGFALNF